MQAPYTDPTTGLRYHDKSVYEIIKGLVSPIYKITRELADQIAGQSTSIAKDYLSGSYIMNLESIIRTYLCTKLGAYALLSSNPGETFRKQCISFSYMYITVKLYHSFSTASASSFMSYSFSEISASKAAASADRGRNLTGNASGKLIKS